MAFIGAKTLLCLVAVFAGTTTARNVLVERDAAAADGDEYVVVVDPEATVADGGQYEVETESDIEFGDFTEGRKKRRKFVFNAVFLCTIYSYTTHSHICLRYNFVLHTHYIIISTCSCRGRSDLELYGSVQRGLEHLQRALRDQPGGGGRGLHAGWPRLHK